MIGVGMLLGGIAGGVSAAMSGGNVWAGIGVGAAIGAFAGGMSYAALGIGMGTFGITSIATQATMFQGAFIGALTGATMGFGTGMATGYAGGQGSFGDMVAGGAWGVLGGAISGGITGGFSSSQFWNGISGNGWYTTAEIQSLNRFISNFQWVEAQLADQYGSLAGRIMSDKAIAGFGQNPIIPIGPVAPQNPPPGPVTEYIPWYKWLWRHVHADVGYTGAANGKLGPAFNFGMKITSRGFYGYYGVGLGAGRGGSATLNFGSVVDSGLSVDFTARGGVGKLGGYISVSAEEGGLSGTAGIGPGILAGFEAGANNTIRIKPW